MTDKELKKLNRTELLQLLMDQVQENEQLKSQVSALTEQISQHRITCENAGSIAEAALVLSNIFQDADLAARKYLQELEERAAWQEKDLQKQAANAREQANKLVEDAIGSANTTREEANAYLADAKAKAEVILVEAEQSAAKIREEAENLLNDTKIQAEKRRKEEMSSF